MSDTAPTRKRNFRQGRGFSCERSAAGFSCERSAAAPFGLPSRRTGGGWRGFGVVVGGLVALVALGEGLAGAQVAPPPVELASANGDWKLTLGGWIDAYVGYNFNDPASRTNNVRAFDTRHDSFALQVAAFDVGFETSSQKGRASGGMVSRLTLQAGDEPDQYYRASGSEKTADATPNYDAFRHIQQAYAGYKVPVPGAGETGMLEVDAGIMISHIGYEGLNAKDNIHFSRSLLHQLTPFYASGARAIYTLSPKVTAQINVSNGWNNVIDNNRSKSVGAQLVWTPNPRITATLNWLGGSEQDAALSMRNLFDAVGVFKLTPALQLAINGHVGIDKVRAGTPLNGAITIEDTRVSWYGLALYARYQLSEMWGAGIRAEAFRDENGVPWETGVATTLWEGTATLEARPDPHLIFRLELRHDEATALLYDQNTPGATGHAQTTLMAGVIAFF